MENPPPAPVRITETVKSPEKIQFSPHFRALHGRILLGGNTLNPDNKNISPVTKEALINGSPQILNECATNCRGREATVAKDQLEGEISSRVAKNTLVLKQDLSKIKGFDLEKAARWQSTLTKLFGKDTATATDAEVRALFDKYFYSKDKLGNASDTDLFAEDVLKAFEGNTEAIEKNADCIVWYARICGFTQDYSETVFRHQITAKALLNNNPDQLVEELNQKQVEDKPARINDTNEDEDQVLQFIWGNKGRAPDEVKPDETKPTPETEDEANKKKYLQSKEASLQFIMDSTTTVDKFNQHIEKLGMEKLTEDQFKLMRENENERGKMARNLVIGPQKIYLTNILTRKAEDDEIKKLSAEEQQAIGLNNLIGMKTAVKDENGLKEARENLEKLLKEHNINLEELVDNYSEALNSKGPLIKEEVDRQIQAFEKKTDAWEAKQAEVTEQKPAETIINPPAEASKKDEVEEKKKKPNWIEKLKERISNRRNKKPTK